MLLPAATTAIATDNLFQIISYMRNYGSIDRTPTLFDNDDLLSESDFAPEDMEPSSSTPFV
jgi:hypothetical protein